MATVTADAILVIIDRRYIFIGKSYGLIFRRTDFDANAAADTFFFIDYRLCQHRLRNIGILFIMVALELGLVAVL